MVKRLFDYELNENVDLFVLIKSAQARLAKNGKQFIAFEFEDKSGEISAKYWDATDEEVQRYQSGLVIHLSGKRENYQGNPQIKIYQIRLANNNEPNNPELYMQSAPKSANEMAAELDEFVFKIRNSTWNRIVRVLLQKYREKFLIYPAAKKNHHAFQGGLAYHTLTILKLAQSVAKLYPHVDESLLYAGAILHDLGKVIELSGPVGTQYTIEGNLLGHITIVDEEIIKACQQLKIASDKEDAVLLRHMVLSHHGLLEYGSPVAPHILEAEILHHLDDLDASIQMIDNSLEHTPQGEFSERVYGLDGRFFYQRKNK